MESLLKPKSVAVVGVSENTSKLATVIFNNIVDGGYKGEIFPVNPKYDKLFGYKCFKNVAGVKEKIDLAVIVIPAEYVLDVVKDCAKARVKNVIIISAGFKETGPQGQILEEKVLATAKEAGMRILGPNCLGLISPRASLNASFSNSLSSIGDIAIISQSGAVNTALLDISAENNLGFYDFVSLGNKSDLNEMDFVRFWLKDPKIKVIGAYLEDIFDGKDLVDIARENPGKPIVILNPGKSKKAIEAIQSHTGSLTSAAAVTEAAFEQAGIIKVDTIEEFAATLMAFSQAKMPSSNKTAIITNAGGMGIVITDMVEEAGLELPKLTDATKVQLKNYLPPQASVKNPIDLVGDALSDRYAKALELVSVDPNIDSMLVVLTPQYITQIEETAKAIIAAVTRTNKPIIPVFIGGKHVQMGLNLLYNKKIAAYKSPEAAVSALKNLVQFALKPPMLKIKSKFTAGRYIKEVRASIKSKPTALAQDLTQKIAAEFKLDTPKEAVIKKSTEAAVFASKYGYPLVLKATAEDILHKTDFKALFLNLKSEGDLKHAYETLRENILKHTGNKNPKLLIQEYLPDGEELIVGVNRDGKANVYEKDGKGFGHTILFGKGGIYTEVFADTSLGLVPMTRQNIHDLIFKTKVSKIIKGIRGRRELALDKLIETIEKVQKMVLTYPEIASIDINPVKLTENRCIVLDFKIIIAG